MRKQIAIYFTATLVFGIGTAVGASDSGAYTQDGSGKAVRNASGLCWRTGYWTPRDAVTGCDGDLIPPIGKPTAPDFLAAPGEVTSVSPLAVAIVKRCDFEMTIDSDNAFDFGIDHLSAIGKKRVAAEFRQKINNCSTIESVIVSAHTDRLGKAADNRRLSERRAASLSEILASNDMTISIKTRGLGSTQPVSHCPHHLTKTALIQCLSADRRATIEVRGISKLKLVDAHKFIYVNVFNCKWKHFHNTLRINDNVCET